MNVTINSDISLQATIGDLRELYRQHKFLRVSVKTGKDRSLDFNSLSHCWYSQLARELREYDALGYKCYCKLHHAIPILRAEDSQFREFYDTAVKGLTYEVKLQAMKFIPATSLMTNTQFGAYMEAVQEDFRGRGVMLDFPEPEE